MLLTIPKGEERTSSLIPGEEEGTHSRPGTGAAGGDIVPPGVEGAVLGELGGRDNVPHPPVGLRSGKLSVDLSGLSWSTLIRLTGEASTLLVWRRVERAGRATSITDRTVMSSSVSDS